MSYETCILLLALSVCVCILTTSHMLQRAYHTICPFTAGENVCHFISGLLIMLLPVMSGDILALSYGNLTFGPLWIAGTIALPLFYGAILMLIMIRLAPSTLDEGMERLEQRYDRY